MSQRVLIADDHLLTGGILGRIGGNNPDALTDPHAGGPAKNSEGPLHQEDRGRDASARGNG